MFIWEEKPGEFTAYPGGKYRNRKPRTFATLALAQAFIDALVTKEEAPAAAKKSVAAVYRQPAPAPAKPAVFSALLNFREGSQYASLRGRALPVVEICGNRVSVRLTPDVWPAAEYCFGKEIVLDTYMNTGEVAGFLGTATFAK